VGRNIKKTGLVAGMLILVGGCQNVGPMAIDSGRDRYTTVLQSTAKVQTLSNIIRVHANESTSFVDVSEIDSTTTASGTAGGTLSGIGSKPGTFGLLGSLTGSATYTEAPLVRFVPLSGQGLVSQMVRPLDVDAIESLITSKWPAVAVLDLVALNLAPDQGNAFLALNIISLLQADSAVTLTAGKSDLTTETPAAQQQNGGNNSNANRTPANDSLIIFYRRTRSGTSTAPKSEVDIIPRLWNLLKSIYGGTQNNPGDYIDLRTRPVLPAKRPANFDTIEPLLITYSGMGILKHATGTPGPKIRFVTRDKYEAIKNNPWNLKADKLGFYMLLPEEEKGDKPKEEDDNPQYNNKFMSKCNDYMLKNFNCDINKVIGHWIESVDLRQKNRDTTDLMIYRPQKDLILDDDFALGNRRLGTLRRYLLIIEDDAAPPDAYIAYPYGRKWYYIAADDPVSQKNFHLMSLLLTMMSVPSTLSPITTSISTGGGG
jgi:hypothetical protein